MSILSGIFDRMAEAIGQKNKELAAQKERLNFLLTSSPAVIYTCRTSGDFGATFISSNVEKQMGYNADDFTKDPKCWAAHIHPEDRERVFADLKHLFDAGYHAHEYRIQHKDGDYRWVHDELKLIRDESGNPAEMVGSWIDITERKQAEESLQESHAKLERNLKGTIDIISETIEQKGSYAPGHHRRVAALASAIAREMGLTPFQVQGIELAAAVHDIGLMNIPREFLQDTNRMEGLKLTMYQGYPQAGHDALKKIEFPWPIAEIILQHRECYDGSGFPQGIRGEEILIEARILAVAVALEDLTTHRSYRNAFSLDQALEEISAHSGSKYNPAVVAASLKLFNEKGYKMEG